MKFLLTLIFIVFTSFLSFSQEQNNLESLTSGKWKIESVEIEDEVMNVKDEGHWMVFYPDGLYQIYLDNEEQVGTWKIDKEKGLKFDDEAIDGKSIIKQLDDKALKFSISGYTLALTK